MRSALAVALWLGCAGGEARHPGASSGPCVIDQIAGPLRGGELAVDDDCKTPTPTCKARCDRGDGNMCIQYALALQLDDAPEPDVTDLFARACRLGSGLGCTKYALRLRETHDSTATSCATRIFERTCSAREPYGCAALGMVMVDTARDAAELEKGRQVLERTCEELDGAPCYMLAIYLQQGKFGAADEAQLGHLLSKACVGNIADACDPYGLRSQHIDR